MKEQTIFPTTNYSIFPHRYYFLSIINNIIKIADLENTNKSILDFGCGEKIFSKILKNKKIINYDIKPEYTECESYEDLHFDIVIFNHVLMYLTPNEIVQLLDKIKKISPNCEIIAGIGKLNIISKIAKTLALHFSAHKNTMSTYKKQVDILNSKTKLIKKKSGVFFMTDIYYSKF